MDREQLIAEAKKILGGVEYHLNGVNPTVNLNIVLGGGSEEFEEVTDDEIICDQGLFRFAKGIEKSLAESPIINSSRMDIADDMEAMCHMLKLTLEQQTGPDFLSALVRIGAACLALCRTMPGFEPEVEMEEEEEDD